MSMGINLQQVLVADGMGVFVCILLIAANVWKLNENNSESKSLVRMLICVTFSCFADAMSFVMDGKPGTISRMLVIFFNFWLFFSNVLVMPVWLNMVAAHMGERFSKRHTLFIGSICAIGTVILVVNFFVPIVFSVDENNAYHREDFYWFFLFMEFVVIVDGILFYIRAKKKGGILKFFPVWQFICPVILGIVIQAMFYGISTIWSFIALSMVGLMANLQNEDVYHDRLTGLYNRYYLDHIKKEIQNRPKHEYTFMMLDMNGFKEINDIYGHAAGDEALIKSAGIIRNAVGSLGSTVRYAGDEFVVLLNTEDIPTIENCEAAIRKGFLDFNSLKMAQYSLSVSIGYSIIDLSEKTIDEILNEVDRKMYDDKRKFYIDNPKADRRK